MNTAKERYSRYLSEIDFEEIQLDFLDTNRIMSIETKKGIVLSLPNTTDLWITRKITMMNVLNVPTAMESALDEFEIRDSFGMVIWEGTAEETYQYSVGFAKEE